MSEEDRKRKAAEAEAQAQDQKLPYPKSVFFIVGNEFCERFSYYGMKAILSIYLKKKLGYSEDKATVIYHTFSMFCYFTPIFGAMIADMFLGKFKTIVYISTIYILGHVLKTVAAFPDIGVDPVSFSLIGLALIALGTGGIKPCVSAFGGDQFKLPEQTRQLQSFFSVFYFSINLGSLISTYLTPQLREMDCFGGEDCYSVAFGVPALLMIVATIIIIIGRPLYTMKPPQGNIIPSVVGCVLYGLKQKLAGEKAEHWLDLAKDKYEDRLVEDVKAVMRVLVLYLPLPIWWALFDQTGSRWTFQAERMNGAVGGVIIQPDQMQMANPFLILFLIPIFDWGVYPVFAKFGLLVKPLQRMAAGGILTAGAFFIAGFLEIEMMKTYSKAPLEDMSHVFVVNSLPCPINVQLERSGHIQEFNIPQFDSFVQNEVHPGDYTAKIVANATCLPNILNIRAAETKVTAMAGNVSSVLVAVNGGSIKPTALKQPEEPEKEGAIGRVRFVQDLGLLSAETNLTLVSAGKDYTLLLHQDEAISQHEYLKMDIGEYMVKIGDEEVDTIQVEQGGVYSVHIAKDPVSGKMGVNMFTLSVPNSVHIMWLLPQYFVITVGEIMFSITGLEFSYSQAPESMKSVLQACWLLTVAFGNIIVIIVAEAKAFNRAGEFFMFAILMIIDMFVFAWLAYRYVPRDQREAAIAMENTAGVYNPSYKNDD